METILFYPVYLLIGIIFTLILIPQKDYKEYFIYGFTLGALGDIIVVTLFQDLFHVMWFKNLGFFNVLGQHALSPPSWAVTMMLFLRFLPERRPFLYLYLVTFAAFSIGYGYILSNLGLLGFRPWFYPIAAYGVFLGWWSTAAWIFKKTSSFTDNKSLLKN